MNSSDIIKNLQSASEHLRSSTHTSDRLLRSARVRVPSPGKREALIRKAEQFAPDYARENVRPAFEGDADEASWLVFRLHDYQRATMAALMYRARVDPAAFREVLSGALSQSHYYSDVLRQARGRTGLARWLRYAEYTLPEDLPDVVTIYRGVNGCTPWQAAGGLFWSLDFDVAAWFACHYRGQNGYVVKATISRSELVYYNDERDEREVIPASIPWPISVVDDTTVLAEAAARKQSLIMQSQWDLLAKAHSKRAA
jgi:hypothetical protein